VSISKNDKNLLYAGNQAIILRLEQCPKTIYIIFKAIYIKREKKIFLNFYQLNFIQNLYIFHIS